MESFGVNLSPHITDTLTASALEKFTDDELAEFAESCRKLAQQFDVTLRRRKGIARTIRV